MTLRNFISLFLCIASFNLLANEERVQFQYSTHQIGASITSPESEVQWGVVLVSVAGPTDRDLSLGKHKYFGTLASALSDHNIVSIRYDDLGVGESTGDVLQTTLNDRMEMACLAKEFLVKKTNLPADRIGFIGMSEGAGISLMANTICGSNPFQVLLSAPVRNGTTELNQQMSRLIDSSMFTEEQKKDIKTQGRHYLSLVSSTNPHDLEAELLAFFKSPYGPLILPPYQFVPSGPEEKVKFVLSPWYQSQINYDVSAGLEFKNVPTLAIYGTQDLVINADENIKVLQSSLPNLTSHMLAKINHLMQASNTGSPMEYATLETDFSSQASTLIVEWISMLSEETRNQ